MKLIELLTQSLAFDAEYGDKLSNHLPMLLAALNRLGATDAQLDSAFTRYSTQTSTQTGAQVALHAMPALQAWPLGEPWKEPLGQPLAWPRYRDLFAMWLREEGAGAVLNQTLGGLLPGCGAAAFHGLIRTAYAVETAHSAEVAHALAYWASRWMDLGLTPNAMLNPAQDDARTALAVGNTVSDPEALVRRAAALRGVAASKAAFIAERMHHAAHTPGFATAVQPLLLDGDTLQRLSRWAAQSYARSGSFTVLHLVTSAWAMRVLLPFVDEPDQPQALACYWRAFAAAAASEWPRLKLDAAPPKARPWNDLVQAALRSEDEHLVKLVDSCRQEQQHWGGEGDWQRAATRAVQQQHQQ